MTTLDFHPGYFMPTEILEHIFSFLPVRDRHNVSHMCKLWATAISSASVWSFTEVHCNSDKTEEEEDDDTLSSLLQTIQPYMGHVQYLKIVLDMSLELNWRLACTILDVMAWKSRKLEGIQIICYGKSPFFYSGKDLLHSLRRLFQGMDMPTMQHIDLRQMPFVLDNGIISLVASRSPNLHTLHINNHVPGLTMLRMGTIIEVLRTCPKLSTLGVPYVVLSRNVFQELLRPNREPFKYLELFYDGLDNDVPEDCWTSARVRHPSFHVGLEFSANVTTQKMIHVLKPYLPISQLHFNAFSHMAKQVAIIANLYGGTLERMVFHSSPSIELNVALIQLAKACSHLKEIHCFCMVGEGVVEAFQRHCPHLKRYTLCDTLFFRTGGCVTFSTQECSLNGRCKQTQFLRQLQF